MRWLTSLVLLVGCVATYEPKPDGGKPGLGSTHFRDASTIDADLPLCSDLPTCGVFVHNPDGVCAGDDNGQPCTCACP